MSLTFVHIQIHVDYLYLPHEAVHCCRLVNLLLLPPHPPYENNSQLPEEELKNQRGNTPRHGPVL